MLISDIQNNCFGYQQMFCRTIFDIQKTISNIKNKCLFLISENSYCTLFLISEIILVSMKQFIFSFYGLVYVDVSRGVALAE